MFTSVSADTVSAACPAHPGNLATTSITFAAIICEADDHSSVNTAYAPRVIFYCVSSEHDLSFAFLALWFKLGILEKTHVHQCSKVDFPLLFLCFKSNILSALHFIHLPSKIFQASPILYSRQLSHPECSSHGA